MKKISIIIASLNYDADLIETINSCHKQVGVDLDLVVCIKSAIDLIPKVVNDLSHIYPVTYIYYNDSGIADAWNLSITFAAGDYYNFLGSGDLFIDALSLKNLSDPHNIHSDKSNLIVTYGKQLLNCYPLRQSHNYFPGDEHRNIRRCMIIPHASSLWPKALFELTLFSSRYPISVDYDFLLRTHNILSFVFVDFEIASVLPGGISNNPEKLLSVIVQDFQIKCSLGYNPFTGIRLNFKRFLRWLMKK